MYTGFKGFVAVIDAQDTIRNVAKLNNGAVTAVKHTSVSIHSFPGILVQFDSGVSDRDPGCYKFGTGFWEKIGNFFEVDKIITSDMKKLIVYFSLSYIVACNNPKEIVVHSVTKEALVGYAPTCKYRIGKTRYIDLPKDLLDNMDNNDTLFLSFNFIPSNKKSETLVNAWVMRNSMTSKGLKDGDPMEKALRLYGNPDATDLLYSEEGNIRWGFEGLFYKDMAILIDTSNYTVRAISVGNPFLMDKKFRKESVWFNAQKQPRHY